MLLSVFGKFVLEGGVFYTSTWYWPLYDADKILISLSFVNLFYLLHNTRRIMQQYLEEEL